MFAQSSGPYSQRMHPRGPRRRAVVALQVGVMMTVLVGFAALTIDVGAMYNTKADLQRTVDAAALAAASRLSMNGEDIDPLDLARVAATGYVEANPVIGHTVTIDSAVDVVFGRAQYDADTNSYTFTPTDAVPDAVRVTVRHTEGSPNGPVPLYFAHVFGKSHTEMTVSATAVMVPRDIAIVADLSGSHTDDSELGNYKSTEINLYDVWAAFPGGIDDVGGSWDPDEIPAGWEEDDGSTPQAAGPAWGYFKKMGYGTMNITSSYSPSSDSGLVQLSKNVTWSNNTLKNWVIARGYTTAEANALFNKQYDSNGAYPYRVAVALGLADWYSGMSNGYWKQAGIPQNQAGNNNANVQSNEVVFTEKFGDRSINESKTIFLDYINNYMSSGSTAMHQENSAFRYRYGVKTFVNYLLETRVSHDMTPELAETPHQPMQAVKEAVGFLTQTIDEMNTDDQLSLEIYGTTAVHEVDLTQDEYEISERLAAMQAGHYDSWTNMGGGIERAIEELTSERARPSARKVIFLLTDGWANVTAGGATGNESGGTAYALDQAEEAVELGFQIYCVSVGSNSNTNLMDQIAEMGSGEHFHAEGSIEEYSEQLAEIFERLGGKRPVELIE